MKIVKLMLAIVALSALCFSNAHARDRVDININAYRYVAPQISHYPNTVYYSRTPTVIYYSAPAVVQYVPIINTQPRYLPRYSQSHFSNHHRDYYRDWNQGWRQHGGRNHDDRGYNDRSHRHGHRDRD